jgi:hypothetical protein
MQNTAKPLPNLCQTPTIDCKKCNEVVVLTKTGPGYPAADRSRMSPTGFLGDLYKECTDLPCRFRAAVISLFIEKTRSKLFQSS